jgi:ABC-type bacteriocin/lantibiotic exporter with double-glycine peptidase domain
MFLVVLFVINWTAAVITGIFMIVMIGLTMQRINLSIAQDSTANLEIFLTGLLTITVMAIGSVQIIQGELDIGLLIGSNILAARALIGANKYAKAKEAIDRREQATNTIYNFIK